MNYQDKLFNEKDFAPVRKNVYVINQNQNILYLDIPCCIIFLIFILCFVILSIFAFQEGIYLSKISIKYFNKINR
jgi:hypothetical protein